MITYVNSLFTASIFSQSTPDLIYLRQDKLGNIKLWWGGVWANRPNFQQAWYCEGWPDSPGQRCPPHQAARIKAQKQVPFEASWVECMGQYWGEGNNGGAEAGGVRIWGGRDKNIPWTSTLNMVQLLQWVSDNELSWWECLWIHDDMH